MREGQRMWNKKKYIRVKRKKKRKKERKKERNIGKGELKCTKGRECGIKRNISV